MLQLAIEWVKTQPVCIIEHGIFDLVDRAPGGSNSIWILISAPSVPRPPRATATASHPSAAAAADSNWATGRGFR